MGDVVTYKCPSCAAGLSFDIERQIWHCNFCTNDFTLEDIQNAQEEAEPPLSSTTERHETFSDEAAVYSCPSCGGRIITDRNTAATFCVYCHNPTIIASRLEGEYHPEQIIPFKLQKEEVLEALRKFCRRRPLLPRDFIGYVEKGEVGGLYVPYWLFDADVDATLTATGLRITTWSDSRYRYRKTDTFRVERAASLSFRGIPADGSSTMDDRLMEALEPFDYGQMVDFSMQYLSGHFADSYDVDAKTSASRVVPRIRSSVDNIMQGDIKGFTTVRSTRTSSNTKRFLDRYVMLPVWTLSADYGGSRYVYAMNGQTGKVAGNLPISKSRALAIFGGVAAVVSAIAFVIGGLL